MVSIIVARTRNGMIGRDNDYPWYLSNDLKRFRALTLGQTIIMGRTTYEHILKRLGKPLPERINIVVTHNHDFKAPGVVVAHSLEEALRVSRAKEREVFVIGGGRIYEAALPHTDRIYVTEVETELDGDTYFPELNETDWKEVSREAHKKDAKHDYDYNFVVLERR